MNKLITTSNGGESFFLDDLRWGNDAIIEALTSYLQGIGTDFIISGCVVDGTTIGAGYIMLNGEILKVDMHTKTHDYFEKIVTYDANGHTEYQDSTFHEVYQKNRATATSLTGTLKYDGSEYVGGLKGTTTGKVPVIGSEWNVNKLCVVNDTDKTIRSSVGTGSSVGDVPIIGTEWTEGRIASVSGGKIMGGIFRGLTPDAVVNVETTLTAGQIVKVGTTGFVNGGKEYYGKELAVNSSAPRTVTHNLNIPLANQFIFLAVQDTLCYGVVITANNTTNSFTIYSDTVDLSVDVVWRLYDNRT